MQKFHSIQALIYFIRFYEKVSFSQLTYYILRCMLYLVYFMRFLYRRICVFFSCRGDFNPSSHTYIVIYKKHERVFIPGDVPPLPRSNLFLTVRDFSVVYSYNHCLPLTSGFLLASWLSRTPLPFQIENDCPRKYDVCAPQNFGAM